MTDLIFHDTPDAEIKAIVEIVFSNYQNAIHDGRVEPLKKNARKTRFAAMVNAPRVTPGWRPEEDLKKTW